MMPYDSNAYQPKGRFDMPDFKQLLQIAKSFTDDDEIDAKQLSNMIRMCQFVLDRLYENGNVLIPTHKENEINKNEQ